MKKAKKWEKTLEKIDCLEEMENEAYEAWDIVGKDPLFVGQNLLV